MFSLNLVFVRLLCVVALVAQFQIVFAKKVKVIKPQERLAIYHDLYGDVPENKRNDKYLLQFWITTRYQNYYPVQIPLAKRDNKLVRSRSKRKKLIKIYKKYALDLAKPYMSSGEFRMQDFTWEWLLFKTNDMRKSLEIIAASKVGLKIDFD